MPDQLHRDLQGVRTMVDRALARIDDLHALFERDRWWRRVGKVMVLLAFVTSGLFWAYDQQSRCHRGNQTRKDTRTAIAAALDQAYEEAGEVHGAERDRRVASVEAVIADAIPLRDC